MAITAEVKDLIKVLQTYPKNAKVYLSVDEEGNGYGTIKAAPVTKDPEFISLEHHDQDNIVILFPWEERLEFEEIAPKEVKGWK